MPYIERAQPYLESVYHRMDTARNTYQTVASHLSVNGFFNAIEYGMDLIIPPADPSDTISTHAETVSGRVRDLTATVFTRVFRRCQSNMMNSVPDDSKQSQNTADLVASADAELEKAKRNWLTSATTDALAAAVRVVKDLTRAEGAVEALMVALHSQQPSRPVQELLTECCRESDDMNLCTYGISRSLLVVFLRDDDGIPREDCVAQIEAARYRFDRSPAVGTVDFVLAHRGRMDTSLLTPMLECHGLGMSPKFCDKRGALFAAFGVDASDDVHRAASHVELHVATLRAMLASYVTSFIGCKSPSAMLLRDGHLVSAGSTSYLVENIIQTYNSAHSSFLCLPHPPSHSECSNSSAYTPSSEVHHTSNDREMENNLHETLAGISLSSPEQQQEENLSIPSTDTDSAMC
eukprot:TRINITY_DN19679_c0_g1::TRINITY_DN19679_c0_g1_i1::g.3306::m.3306 TRINITY_DN19679_c0_g1::TRINITY_DN19679_c0_g1_i1::g.3306  ORF type:complete len:407 (-),score=37.50 TRINITY_DN19679_c0_g1_i1:494-1714(-)